MRFLLCTAIGLFGCLAPVGANAADPPSDIGETVPPPASWDTSFSVDLVYATRNSGDGLIIEDTVTGDPVLTGDDLGFGWAPGVDARLSVDRGNTDIDFRFLGAFSFEDSATVTTPAIWNFPTDPPLFGLGEADIVADYDSSLNSLELNLSRPMGNGTVFAGLRGLVLNEELVNDADFGGNQAAINFNADTVGIGPQIGGEMRFGGPVFIDVDGRIGALVTRSELGMSVDQEIGPAFGASGSPWDWAAVAEAGVAAGVKLGPRSALKLGYRIIFIHNVPTATSSVAAVDVLDESIGHNGDSFFAHGVTFGFESEF